MEKTLKKFILLSILFHFIIGIIGFKIFVKNPEERPVLFRAKILQLTKPESIEKLQMVSSLAKQLKDFTKEMVETKFEQNKEEMAKIKERLGVIGVKSSKFLISPTGKGISTKMVDPYAKDYGKGIGTVFDSSGKKGHKGVVGVYGGQSGSSAKESLGTSLIIQKEQVAQQEPVTAKPPSTPGITSGGGGGSSSSTKAASYEFGIFYPEQRMLMSNPQSSGGQVTVSAYSGVSPQQYVFYLLDRNTGRRYMSNKPSDCQATPMGPNTYRYRFSAGNVTLIIRFK